MPENVSENEAAAPESANTAGLGEFISKEQVAEAAAKAATATAAPPGGTGT